MTVVPSCSYLASVHICVHIGCFLSRGLPKVISTAVEFQFFMLVLTALFYVVDYAGSATVQARAEPPELSSAYFKSTGAQVLTSAKDGCCDCGRTRWSAYVYRRGTRHCHVCTDTTVHGSRGTSNFVVSGSHTHEYIRIGYQVQEQYITW